MKRIVIAVLVAGMLGLASAKAQVIDGGVYGDTKAASSCSTPQNILGSSTPSYSQFNDGPFELGLKFTASANGHVTGARFWKTTSMNSETHIGYLYDNSGTQLATVTFTGETSSGWQEMAFGSSVAITGGTTYMIAVSMPTDYVESGGYSYPHSNGGCLTSSSTNAYYWTGAAGNFPNNLSSGASYWVDVTVSFP